MNQTPETTEVQVQNDPYNMKKGPKKPKQTGPYNKTLEKTRKAEQKQHLNNK